MDEIAGVGGVETIKENSGESKKLVIFSIVGVVILILVIGLFFVFYPIREEIKILNCGDGTSFEECSLRKPYFCEEGVLVEKASVCGCNENLSLNGESCTSDFQLEPKEISLKYILREEEKNISFVVYENMSNYVSSLPIVIRYEGGETASRGDFKLRNINEPNQRELLLPLISAIQNEADNEEDRFRIAVSIVQNIPFGNSNKTDDAGFAEVVHSRYPYEVLFDYQGVCGEKSDLPLFILREMGYGVAFFYYAEENHEAMGVKCPTEFGVDNTSYCFIETTAPSIITDEEIVYVGGITLDSDPEVFPISEGKSLEGDFYEYEDVREYRDLKNRFVGGERFNPLEYRKLTKFEEKYGLVSEYHPG